MKLNANFKRVLAALTASLLITSAFAACKKDAVETSSEEPPKVTDTPRPTDEPKVEETEAPKETEEPKEVEEVEESDAPEEEEQEDEGSAYSAHEKDVLVVASSDLSSRFNPFLWETAYDHAVTAYTYVNLLIADRRQEVIYNGIEGETIPYNGTDYTYKNIADLKVESRPDDDVYDESGKKVGTTVYTWTLKDGLVFSDGVPMTADDIIFSYYTYIDPTFTGASTLYAEPIVGLKAYRDQVADLSGLFDETLSAGREANGEYTEQVFGDIDKAWKAVCEDIVKTVNTKYASSAEDMTGFTSDEVAKTPGLQIAFGMVAWGFGDIEDGVLTTDEGVEFDLKGGDYPTIDDYYATTFVAYDGDASAFSTTEDPDGKDIVAPLRATFLETAIANASADTFTVPNVEGIKKLDDLTVEVTTVGFSAEAVYALGITVSPMHYYGNTAKYDYDNNMFGFDYGDLSVMKSKMSTPLGAGPYIFDDYKDKVVYYHANPNYFLGEPKTKNLQVKTIGTDDEVPALVNGAVDVANPSYSDSNKNSIMGENSNGQLVGDVVTTEKVTNDGWGYVAMNAQTVKVGEGNDPSVTNSEASINFRKAIATVVAARREVAIDSYYKGDAEVINYPVTLVNWTAPQKSDQGYRVAYSLDINGNELYSEGMSADEKNARAMEAAIEYMEAAGFTFTDGKVTAAPVGAKLSYELIIPAGGKENHPAFMLVTEVIADFAKIGFEIVLNNPEDGNKLWDSLRAGTQEIFFAAWGGGSPEPGLTQLYSAANIPKNGGEGNNYGLEDPELDAMALAAKTIPDKTARKAAYVACYDKVMSSAVVVPIYQRSNCIILSTQRIQIDTTEQDVTPFWEWKEHIENVMLVQ